MIKILFICHGNICRSPMAESVMTDLVRKAGLSHQFEIASAATSREEIGNGVHHGTVRKLRQEGVPLIPHRAVQMTQKDYEYYDLIIGMDGMNYRNMLRIAGGDPEGKLHLLTEYSGKGGDIADPWYTGNFDNTYRDVLAGCQGLFQWIQENRLRR